MIRDSYHKIERQAVSELVKLLPDELQPTYKKFVDEEALEQDARNIIKMADTLSAYLKCRYEINGVGSNLAQAV